jgi:hypothetical protein
LSQGPDEIVIIVPKAAMLYVLVNELVYGEKPKLSRLASHNIVSRLDKPIEQKKSVAAFINVYCR